MSRSNFESKLPFFLLEQEMRVSLWFEEKRTFACKTNEKEIFCEYQ